MLLSPIDVKSREDNFGGTRERLLICSPNWFLGYVGSQSSHAHFLTLVEEKWRPSVTSYFCVNCVAILERLVLTRYFIINPRINLNVWKYSLYHEVYKLCDVFQEIAISFGAGLQTLLRCALWRTTHISVYRRISGNQDANQKRGSLEVLVDNSFGVSVSKLTC